MSGKKLVLLLTAALFAATLWGCGSNRGDSDSPALKEMELESAEYVGNCTICHTVDVHTSFSPLAGKNVDASGYGSAISHNCEACHGGGQFHRGQGPIPFPAPDADRCAKCHSETDDVIDSGLHMAGSVPNCAACHDSLTASVRQVNGGIGCIDCHTTKTEAALQEKPFSDEITQRVESGRHTDGKARGGKCAACHTAEGAQVLFAQGEKVSTIAQINALEDKLTALGSASELSKKNCASCHDPHTGTLLGIGDVKETFTLENGSAVERTVYSAEFNLCTTCHQVNLDTTWNSKGGYSNAGIIEYELTGAYAKSEDNADPYSNEQIGYHTNSHQNRSFVDTHFNGELYKKLYYYEVKDGYVKSGDLEGDYFVGVLYAALNRHRTERVVPDGADYDKLVALYDEYVAAADNVAIKGFNVNPGSENACTACHDAHSANKMVKPFNSPYPYAMNFEPEIATAIAYGEGVGISHGNYMAKAFARNSGDGSMYASANCTPCHVGRDFVKMTNGAEKADLGAPAWNVVACVSCHDMAVPFEEDTTVPRDFPEDHIFTFADGETEINAVDLGANQVCFECHKGRKAYDDGADIKTVYGVNYLHYKAQFAILEGVEGMIPSYADKDYTRNWEGHYHVTSGRPTDCVGCHNIHEEYAPYSSHSDTTYGREEFDTSLTTNLCGSCHYYTDPSDTTIWSNGDPTTTKVGRSFNVLEARTEAFADVLKETMLSELAKLVSTDNDAAIIVQGLNGTNVVLSAEERLKYEGRFTAEDGLSFATQTDVAYQMKRLKSYITGSGRDVTGSRLVTNNLATAGAIWKNFNYDDKAGWAHNSILARQTMYDAIQKLDASKLPVIAERYKTKLIDLGFSEVQADAMIAGTASYGNLLENMDAGTTVRDLSVQ